MKIMLIGYCEPEYHIGNFFREALRLAGCEHSVVDDQEYFGGLASSIWQKFFYHLLGRPLNYLAFNRDIVRTAATFRPTLALIVKGAFVSPQTLKKLSALGVKLINYATDDPFNLINSNRDLLAGIPFYDLYACPRRAMMDDIQKAGCPNVAYVPFGYEPRIHYPEAPVNPAEIARFTSDVVFIGNADADRKPVLLPLTQMTRLSIHLRGAFWRRDARFAPLARDFAYGREYRLALTATRIALCLVRRANRDGHVMRTFEIPACGAFMLAERTDEHLAFFREDHEVVYFASNEELCDKINYYLTHEAVRQRIAAAGHSRVTGEQHTYRRRLEQILAYVDQL